MHSGPPIAWSPFPLCIFALGPGAYRVKAVAPDGTEYVTESTGQQGFVVRFHEASDPDGDWTLEDLAGGPARPA